MRLRWTDVHDIAIALEEAHPDADIVNLRFTDLWKWVQDLPEFDDDPNRVEREDPGSHPDGLARRTRVSDPRGY